MAPLSWAAIALVGMLATAGCLGYPGTYGFDGVGYGQAGPYDPYYGSQPYGINPGYAGAYGGGYVIPCQPYYQPYGYPGSGAYVSQPDPAPVDPGVASSDPYPGGTPPAPPGSWIDRRQQYQEERIQRGLASGQLNPEEARRLEIEQARIRGAEQQMAAQGNFSPQERTRLNGMLDKSGQVINRPRHRDFTGPGRHPGAPAQPEPARQFGPQQFGHRQNAGPTAQSGPPRQPGPWAQPRTASPTGPLAQSRPTGQPAAMVQPRPTVQPRPAALARPQAPQPRQNRARVPGAI